MNSEKPVFIQIMEIVENDIIAGVYKPHDLIISTTQISKIYSVNPTTAVKAISKLTDAGILYKKRGIGMCVTEGAYQQIVQKRKEIFLSTSIDRLIDEAKKLGFSTADLIKIISKKGDAKNE